MPPHTKHLKAFHAVARLGSMNKAAVELLRAHSAVAHAIQQLEQGLEQALFERAARGMLLTEAGHILLRRVEYAFAEMEAARTELEDIYTAQDIPPRNAPIFSLAVNERRLAALVALAEQKHMGAVAQQLDISQPAVSMAVRDLEDGIGLALFDRSGTLWQPTGAGEIIINHVKRALSQLRLADAELAAMDGHIRGQIIVGALPFGRPYILPAAISRLHRKHPGLQFNTLEAPLKTLTYALWCGDIDFILGALSPTELYPDLIQENLFSDRMGVIARAGHPLGARPGLTLADTLSADWVLPRQGTPPRQVLRAAFAALGMQEPSATVESSDLSVIRGLLLESDMVTAASSHLFHHEFSAGALQQLPLELVESPRSVGILRRTSEHSSPGAQLLIEEIRQMRGMPTGSTLSACPEGE
ncbi:LysR family transcriptional regulator [Pusillimonas sp.]|uniref:LysR family transcriptional regulator n=1 Tax=Pusillimonas sp. TaxID=3040095 RepID=UPI0037C79CCF